MKFWVLKHHSHTMYLQNKAGQMTSIVRHAFRGSSPEQMLALAHLMKVPAAWIAVEVERVDGNFQEIKQ